MDLTAYDGYERRTGSVVKRFAELKKIEGEHVITKDTDFEFLYQLQKSLLLALKEQGRLNAMQYRHAEEKLKRQVLQHAKNMQQKRSCDDQSCELLPSFDG